MNSNLSRKMWRVASKTTNWAMMFAVPCLAIMAFSPGLMQAFATDAGTAPCCFQDRPVASTPVAQAKTAAQNQVVTLSSWEETCSVQTCNSQCRDNSRNDCDDRGNNNCGKNNYCGNNNNCGNQGGSGSGSGSFTLLTQDVAAAQAQAIAAQGLVQAALTLSQNGLCSCAIADLQLAAKSEQLAATSLLHAAQQAIGLNLNLANQTGGLAQLAIQLQVIATTLALDVTIAQQSCPATSFIQNSVLPTAQQGVTTTTQAANQISGYK